MNCVSSRDGFINRKDETRTYATSNRRSFGGNKTVHHIIELHHGTPVLCEVSAYCCAECDAQGPGSYEIERHKLATNHTLRWVRFPLWEGELVK